MLAVRGVYDGKTVRILPTETVPEVLGEVSVAIVFLEPGGSDAAATQ